MNDIEFMGQFSQEIGAEYQLAKSYVREMPSQALVHLRSLCHCLVKLVATQHSLTYQSPNLYDRVEQLNAQRLLTPRQTRLLHKLRVLGNKGAHPEKYHLTFAQLVTLAEKGIADLLTLAESLGKGSGGNKYLFEPFDEVVGRDLCYRAVMQADPKAQYLVGMSLKTKGLLQLEQDTSLADKQKPNANLQQAAFWFEQAAKFDTKALFEHGVGLLHGYQGHSRIAEGEKAVADAADAGDIEAKALLGYFLLIGNERFAQDLTRAFSLLSEAAEQDHVEAMANLGVYYYQVDDETQAFHWINKAAQAGNPHSQYHLALMLESGQGCEVHGEQSQYWLNEAAEQGQLDAMLMIAKSLLSKEMLTEVESKRVQDYLSDVIKYGRSVSAMLELSVALADGVLGKIDIVKASSLLMTAQDYAKENELEVISPLKQSMLLQIEQVMSLVTSDEELATLVQAREILQSQ